MSDSIKVSDKRMFTADGELREEPSDRASTEEATDNRARSESKADAARVEPEADSAPTAAAAGPDGETDAAAESQGAKGPRQAPPGELPSPTFLDLVGLLAQPIAMFLGDAAMPGSEPEENLPLARFHIDLLEIVQDKTRGNINSEEAKLLEDLLYQLRMRYVEKAG